MPKAASPEIRKPIDISKLNLTVPETLTEEQEARLPEFRERWIQRGMTTGPIDFEAASAAVLITYDLAGLPRPQEIYHARNPYEAGLMGMLCHVMDRAKEDPSKIPTKPVKAEQEPTNFTPEAFEFVCDEVRKQRTEMGIWDEEAWKLTMMWVENEDRKAIYDLLTSRHFGAMLYGCQEAHWLAIYDYLTEVCGTDHAKPYEGLIELSKHCGWWTPYVGAIILQDRPIQMSLNEAFRLHRDGGPAIEYAGNLCGWALNGVRVSQHLAETPAEELDPRELLPNEANAQVRAEIVRKIGVLRCLELMDAEEIHAEPDNAYTLYKVNFEDNELRCLKMRNPSVPDMWHCEWVPNECNTVQDALNFRNQLTPDMIDDENGLEWDQQGDVIIRPSGEGLKFKSRPRQLT